MASAGRGEAARRSFRAQARTTMRELARISSNQVREAGRTAVGQGGAAIGQGNSEQAGHVAAGQGGPATGQGSSANGQGEGLAKSRKRLYSQLCPNFDRACSSAAEVLKADMHFATAEAGRRYAFVQSL